MHLIEIKSLKFVSVLHGYDAFMCHMICAFVFVMRKKILSRLCSVSILIKATIRPCKICVHLPKNPVILQIFIFVPISFLLPSLRVFLSHLAGFCTSIL